MTTKYIVKVKNYGSDGRNWDWTACTNYTTMEECENKAATLEGKQDYIIEARTIDEATFTITDKVVKEYDYYKEVRRYELAPKKIESLIAARADYEARKKRCKKAESKANNDKEIARCNEEIAYWKGLLQERA